MTTAHPVKWAIGDEMVAWCERNNLDPTRIPIHDDAIEVTDDGHAHIWHIVTQTADHPRETWTEQRTRGGHREYRVTVPVDSPPPIAPEWEEWRAMLDAPKARQADDND